MSKVEDSIELSFAKKISTQISNIDGGTLYSKKDNNLHEWTGSFWRIIQVEELESKAWDWLSKNAPDRATPRSAMSCASATLHESTKMPERNKNSSTFLPLKNSTLEIVDNAIRVKSPSREDGLTYVLNCEYDEAATATEFHKFLGEVLADEEVRNYVQEYIGYTLLPDCRFQRAQFWLGGGANGKSTLAEIVGALHENPASIQLDELDGFKLAALVGASLVYVDETPSKINIQKLKSLISGGLSQVDIKYRTPISFRPTAKWIVCGNHLPVIADHSEGFWRRFPIIPFTAHFPDAKQDPLLAKRIIKNELPGILNWAIEGLLRLLERGRFGVIPTAVALAVNQGKQETNSVLAWWLSDDEHEIHPSASAKKDDVYTAYKEWSIKNGVSPVGSANFWKRFKDVAVGEMKEWRASNENRPRMVNVFF